MFELNCEVFSLSSRARHLLALSLPEIRVCSSSTNVGLALQALDREGVINERP
jgi:hypothetical protein